VNWYTTTGAAARMDKIVRELNQRMKLLSTSQVWEV